jgi:hypothetical protein
MANPSAAVYCVVVVELPDLCIPMPGGATICPMSGYDIGDPLAVTNALLGAVNTALAPLAPFFNVLDVALKLFKCVKAIPDMFLSFPPGPQPVVACIPELIKAINKVMQLIPYLSIPSTVKAILSAIIVFLHGLKDKLQAYLNKVIQINAGYARAALMPDSVKAQLTISLDCAAAALEQQRANLGAGFGPINQLITVVSAFMQLAGLGCIPALGNIGPLDDAIFEPIDKVIELLTTIRDAIPDLGGLSLDVGDC